MWFKNKQTGLVWEVVDPDSIKRCNNDSSYEEVDSPIEDSPAVDIPSEDKKSPKQPTKKPVTKK